MRQRIRVAWLPLLFFSGILLFGGPTQAPLDARSPSAVHLGVVLGELLRINESRAVAMVSLREAERIVAGLRPRRGDGSSDHRIGIILGRAAAHEIGHYLLDTSTHAPAGLMRARFDETEFADTRSNAFGLDGEAGNWVQKRLSMGLPLGPAANIPAATSDLVLAEARARPGFSYPR